MTKRYAIKAAMKRLRAEAEMRAVFDEHGKLKYEGSPFPETVENELARMYSAGWIAALTEMTSRWAKNPKPKEGPRIAAEMAEKARAHAK